MRRRTAGAIVGTSVLALGLMGYGAADFAGKVPGFLSPSGAPVLSAPPAFPKASPLEGAGMRIPEGAPVDPGAIAPLWTPVREAAVGGGWSSWGVVLDAATGEVLFEEAAADAHTPASTAKTLTAFAALSSLNPSDVLSTSLLASGSSLHLSSEGDLLLGSGASDPDSVPGRAGIADLAQKAAAALSAAGVSSASLSWDAPPFAGEDRLSALIAQETRDYVGPTASMAIGAGRAGDSDVGFLDDPARAVAATLAKALAAHGVAVSLEGPAPTPEGFETLATIESATVAEQLRWMLHTSDNTLAEQYCRLAARAGGAEPSFDGATAFIRQTLEGAGVSTGGLALEDCSGLSTNDRVSGRTLAEALRTAAASAGALADLPRSLPWAGLNGTMATRMLEGRAFANAQAKTGSLGAVSSLAGIVETTTGRLLVFAVGADGVPDQGAASTRPLLDGFIASLAAL